MKKKEEKNTIQVIYYLLFVLVVIKIWFGICRSVIAIYIYIPHNHFNDDDNYL